LEQLAIAARIPGYLSYGKLRLHPYWDSLRGDPRFEKVIASFAPLSAASSRRNERWSDRQRSTLRHV